MIDLVPLLIIRVPVPAEEPWHTLVWVGIGLSWVPFVLRLLLKNDR